MLFSKKILIQKKEKECLLANAVGKKDAHCRIAVLVVGDMPEIKIYVSTEALFIPYNQFLCAETNFCAFFDCDQKLPKRSNISVTPEVFNVGENMSDIET